MSNIETFKSEEFGSVRIIEENGKYLFCAKDVAIALGYANFRDAIRRHCRGGVKRDSLTEGGNQSVSFIPEGDVYRLITHSKLPSAEKFEKWVFDDVLPSIRKHGGYLTPETIEKFLLNPDTIIRLATDLKNEREERMKLEAKVEEDKPKVALADSVADSDTFLTMDEMAKILKQNGLDIGGNRLRAKLQEMELISKRSKYWFPTQRGAELNIFRVSYFYHRKPDGQIESIPTVKINGKGQIFLVNKLLKEGA